MEVQVEVAKLGKYAVGVSGDSVEVVERPCGGISIVIVDGQGHGKAAKRMSLMIANKAAGLIEDGARDGAVMRVINDHLYAFRDGQVSATATLISQIWPMAVWWSPATLTAPCWWRWKGVPGVWIPLWSPLGFGACSSRQ